MSEVHLLAPPGTLLDGKYLVERRLGQGGMGFVVAARHTVLRTAVAIKMLLPSAMANRETVERFHREGRAAVRLQSPHAVRVHDVGQLEDGVPYMVMELLAGGDLKALLAARGSLPTKEAVGYVLQALEALQEAHALGIVHRDLKPANLFLADQPSGPPILKVLDFGIARDFQESADERLTRTRALMGSPSYMSPEQIREARSADARSDIWSIGVCLYELLTGSAPFDADTLADLFVTVLHGTPVPPSTRRSDVPPQISAIVMRCLEKVPAKRFQSAAELAHALAQSDSQVGWSTSANPRVPPPTSSPSLTGRLASSHTLTEPKRHSRAGYAGVAAAIGAIAVVIAVRALVVRSNRIAPAPARAETSAQIEAVPPPVEEPKPAALPPPEASAPASASVAPAASAPPRGKPSGTGRVVRAPGGAVHPPVAGTGPSPVEVPAAPAPAPPPAFDPKTTF